MLMKDKATGSRIGKARLSESNADLLSVKEQLCDLQKPSHIPDQPLTTHTPMNWRQWGHRLAQLCAVVCACCCFNHFWLCDARDCCPPGSSVHGILQARILEWVAIASPGDLPDPGIEPTSLHVSCIGRQILYHQRHLGRPAQLHPAQIADPPNLDLKKWLLI